jgi:hypothetical protein
VLSTVLAVIEGIRFVIDRPRLKVRSLPIFGIHPAAETVLKVAVINRGRRPTTVTEAGYIVQGEILVGDLEGGERKIMLGNQPTVLASGEMAEYASAPLQSGGFPQAVFLDSPLRAYATDLNGNRVYWLGRVRPLAHPSVERSAQERGRRPQSGCQTFQRAYTGSMGTSSRCVSSIGRGSQTGCEP